MGWKEDALEALGLGEQKERPVPNCTKRLCVSEGDPERWEALKRQAYDLGKSGDPFGKIYDYDTISFEDKCRLRDDYDRGRIDSWKEKAERDRAEAAAKDEAERLEARDFVPAVRVVEYAAGEFVCYDGHEWPRRFIESVSASRSVTVHSPDIPYAPTYTVTAKHPDMVVVRMASGAEDKIAIGRYKVDALLDAISRAWKGEER